MIGSRHGWRLWFCAGAATLLLLGGCAKPPDRTALLEGLRTLDGGRYSQSILLFERAIRDNVSREDNALAYNGLGCAYWRMQQQDNAARAFENAARMDPDLVEPVYNLGVLDFENGKEVEAIACFEKAALLDARETRPLEFLAAIYQKRQQWDETRKALTEARARAPRSPRVLTFLAVLELQTNNVEAAVALLQQALEHDARYAPAVFNLAVTDQRRLNNPDQARAHFKDFLGIVPEGPQADKARQALKELSAAPPAPPAAATASSSPVPPAVTAAPPEPPRPEVKPPVVATQQTVEDWMATAKKLERSGRREAAVNSYLKAAREAERSGNNALREKALRDAGALCADDARSNYELGQYYAEHKQNDQAVTHLKKAVGSSTNWFDAQFALARAALAVEEFDTARLLVKQADQSRPDQADALWALAQLCDRNAGLQDLAAPFYSRFEKQYANDSRAGAARDRIAALQGAAPATADAQNSTNQNLPHLSWWGWLR